MLQKAQEYVLGNKFLQKALDDYEILYGHAHPMTINTVETLVRGLYLLQDYRQAMKLQKRVLKFYENDHGLEDDRTKEAQLVLSTLTERAVAKAKADKLSKIKPESKEAQEIAL